MDIYTKSIQQLESISINTLFNFNLFCQGCQNVSEIYSLNENKKNSKILIYIDLFQLLIRSSSK